MPFVNIRILKGHSKQRKDEISRRVTDAISEVAQLPKEAIWVVFEDVESDDWYVGGDSVVNEAAAEGAAAKLQHAAHLTAGKEPANHAEVAAARERASAELAFIGYVEGIYLATQAEGHVEGGEQAAHAE